MLMVNQNMNNFRERICNLHNGINRKLMKTRFLLLATLAFLPLTAPAATTTIYDQWLSFNNLQGEKGKLTVTLNGTVNSPSVNNGSLTLPGDAYASIDLSGAGNMTGWPTGGYAGIQLTFSASSLSGNYQQLFLFHTAEDSVNKNVDTGVALNNAGIMTDGVGKTSFGTAVSASADQTITLTALYSQAGGVRYYINGEYAGGVTGWKASNATWGSVDIGKTYLTNNGADLQLNGLVLFSVDSTNVADVNAAAKDVFVHLPEPTTTSLGLLGFLALAARRRRHA